ncbi:MAG TPA: hypothetical protein VI461_02855 [Chitinophagaceae bacterium]|nr:hypothetical protein [Chitinophagaceae bacterium]
MNNRTLRTIAILFAVLPIAFSACVKDQCKQTFTYTTYEPVYRTKAEVRANIKSNAPKEVENTGKLYIYGNYIFLNEVDKGIHVINNSNPSQPQNIAFIDLPGNMDIAVKGNILYADMYTDLVALDITNPSNVSVKKAIENIFPHRYWGNGISTENGKIIVDWVQKEKTVTENCYNGGIMPLMDAGIFYSSNSGVRGGSSATAASSPIGMGGSMARFTIMNDRLYTVNTSALDVFNIINASNPVKGNHITVGQNIETIYPFKNKLFIGSQTGMYMYNVGNPDNPVPAGQFNHIRSCDPVIADDDYAYVTLSSGTRCQGFTNELDILKLNNFTNPQLLKVYNMTNPKGLSKSGNHLFICDGVSGLKVYNTADVMSLQLVKTINGIEPFDVIAYNNVALVVAADGLYQYDYSNINDIRLLSKITVNK